MSGVRSCREPCQGRVDLSLVVQGDHLAGGGAAQRCDGDVPTCSALTVPVGALRVATAPSTSENTRVAPCSSASRTRCIMATAACSTLTRPLPGTGQVEESPTVSR